nr:hypothetical protein [Chenggangzhangella methanolivorans]
MLAASVAPGRQAVRQEVEDGGRSDERLLVRMEAEDEAPDEIARTVLDPADRGVAVLHGSGKVALLPGRAHPEPLAFGHAAVEHEAFGAAAHPRKQRAHDSSVAGRAEGCAVAQLDPSVAEIPEGARSSSARTVAARLHAPNWWGRAGWTTA